MPERFGRYELVEEIGRGGMARAFRARLLGVEGFARTVVVKVMHDGLVSDEAKVAMFLDEARLLARMTHPNVVSVVELGREGDRYFIAMEHVDGVDLLAALRPPPVGAPLPIPLACHVVARAATGLHHAHTLRDDDGRPLRVVHRDISHQNLLLSRHGDVKVADFGVARHEARSTKTQRGAILGKVRYMSPEQARGEPLDGRSDVFSLGIVLYELLTRQRLFKGASDRAVLDAVLGAESPPPSRSAPEVDPALDDVVLRALAKRREDRFEDARALAAALDACARGRADVAALSEWVEARRAARERIAAPVDEARAAAPDEPTAPVPRPMGAAQLQDAARPGLDGPRAGARFFGRDRDLRALDAAFDEGARLVTIVGPAGIGKSALAARHASSAGRRAPARAVWTCDLAESFDADAACAAVAQALGVSLQEEGEPARSLGAALGARGPALLVLDNVEQVRAAAADLVSAWRAAAPELRVLVTSRERLRVEGERVLELSSLSSPARGEDAWSSDAVRLFVAAAAAHGARIERRDAERVAAVVRAVDGIPLAIEIAAARAGDLGLAELARRSSRGAADLLEAAARPGDRHATLRAAVEWSWRLLSKDEQAALRRCAVFRGGFGVDAARAVLARDGADGRSDAAALLSALVDKSLLRCEVHPDGHARYALYESVRSFAELALDEAGDREDALVRHARFFVEQGEAWAPRIDFMRTDEAFALLQRERRNLLAVVGRARAGEIDEAFLPRAVLALDALLYHVGPLGPRLQMLDEAIAIAARIGAPGLARLHAERALARQWARRLDEARDDVERAVAVAGAPEEQALIARALATGGIVEIDRGDLRAAEALFLRAVEQARDAGDPAIEGLVLAQLGILRWAEGRVAEARTLLQDGAALLERGGAPTNAAVFFGLLAALRHLEDDLEHADALYRRALDRLRRGGARRFEAIFFGAWSMLLEETSQIDSARRAVAHAVQVAATAGERRVEGLLHACAGAVHAAGLDVAASLASFEQADAILERVGGPADRVVADLLRARLDRLQADAASREGREEDAGALRERFLAKLVVAEAVAAGRGTTMLGEVPDRILAFLGAVVVRQVLRQRGEAQAA